MRQRMIYILIAVMTVVLALLIVVQMNIINGAAQIREEQFSQLVKRCLMRVATQLEEEETRRFIFSEQMISQHYGVQSGMEPLSGSIADVINHTEINFSFQLKKNPDGTIKGHTYYQESDTVIEIDPSGSIVNDPGSFTQLLQQNMRDQQQYYQSIKRRDAFTRHIQYQRSLALSNRPIEKRVNKPELETLLAEEFKRSEIFYDFEYSVKSYNRGEEKVILSSDHYKSNRGKEYQTLLFTNDLGAQKPNYLKVYFPKSRRHFLTSTGFMVVPTIVLVLLIIGIFTYTIGVILRQKKLSEVKNDFINNMTHELKTPISTISLASQMLRDNSVNNSAATIDRISNVIYDESNRLSMQVEKVLQMAVFSEGRLKMKFKDFDLHEVITSVVQNFELRVQNEKGHISYVSKAVNCTIYGDQVHVTNVLFNLLDNAVKYRKGTPEIEVTTENRKNFLVVSVKDNGIGISKEHHKEIFERFYRVPTGNVHDVKGFGLGLHYVSKIIEAHNGIIKVDSAPNKGTKFILYFPLKD
jgi:two-component system, OmpR family, phosphate regulon sensor histidine kinase PhoR